MINNIAVWSKYVICDIKANAEKDHMIILVTLKLLLSGITRLFLSLVGSSFCCLCNLTVLEINSITNSITAIMYAKNPMK